MPTVIKPFYFGAVTGSSPTLILGVYPGTKAATLGATDKKITIESTSAAWETDLYLMKTPAAPTAASEACVALGAKALAVSAAAVALVASSLY